MGGGGLVRFRVLGGGGLVRFRVWGGGDGGGFLVKFWGVFWSKRGGVGQVWGVFWGKMGVFWSGLGVFLEKKWGGKVRGILLVRFRVFVGKERGFLVRIGWVFLVIFISVGGFFGENRGVQLGGGGGW